MCLGAKAVGLGRPFLYAQSVSGWLVVLQELDWHQMFQAYGDAGVSKIIEILRREIMTVMTYVGASTLEDLKPEMASLIYESHVDHWLIPA